MTNKGCVFVYLFLLSLLSGCSRQDTSTVGAEQNEAARVSALLTRIEQLEKEATQLQAVRDIRRLQRAYGYYLDQQLWDQIVDFFAEDGRVEYNQYGVFIGKPRIREFLYSLSGGEQGIHYGQLNEHIILQPVIHVAADGLSAKARWRAWIWSGQYQQNAAWGEGPYENEYVNEDGVWKIKSLHWYPTFMVSYEGGWAEGQVLGGGVKVPQPDQLPTQHYDPWPHVFVPPFHYRHPVTGK